MAICGTKVSVVPTPLMTPSTNSERSAPAGMAWPTMLPMRVTARSMRFMTGCAQAKTMDKRIAGAGLEHSFAGQAGRFIEPAIAPLGFDWRIGIGLITSLAAREVMVSTMATVFNLGNVDNNVQSLRQSLREA